MKISKAFLALCCFLPGYSFADAFKCTDSSGKLMYSDRPCEYNSSKIEKVSGHGASYGKLTSQEREQFQQVVNLNCPHAQEICTCFGDALVSNLKYEEVMQIVNSGGHLQNNQQVQASKLLTRCMANTVNQ
jgi:hypothetical protein